MKPHTAALPLATTLALSLLACGKSERQREGESVAAAIGRMRDAPRHERAPLIDAVAALKPTGELAQKAQNTCLAAYRSLEQGNAELDEVQKALAEAKAAGTEADPALLATLIAAEERIAEAEQGRAACASAVMALQRSLR